MCKLESVHLPASLQELPELNVWENYFRPAIRRALKVLKTKVINQNKQKG